MNIFQFRNKLILDYRSYIESFINIKDERISRYVEAELKKGVLWPNPLIQLNPAFEPGSTVDELVAGETLHEECGKIFRRQKDKQNPAGFPLRLHRHQEEAIHLARKSRNYVLTTGTGSGKSLAYIVPVVDYVLRHGSGNGIKAIVVYPMNALANSQHGELEKFLCEGYPEGHPPVRFGRYTGQEKQDQRAAIIANPPDILLTNYVMLELILTRPEERGLIEAA
ncbi:MAG: DEAD/DEAH box helicase, partial [Opitutales bacterium]